MTELNQLDKDLWVVRRPLPLSVGDLGARMTIMRLADGKLIIHSPVKLDDAIKIELDRLGVVSWVVAPSLVHHLFVTDFLKAYPSARLCAPRGLVDKRPKLRIDLVLEEDQLESWRGHIDYRLVEGSPLLDEFVFFHRSSRTLILTDLAFNVTREGRNKARFFHWLVGAVGRFGPHRLVRLFIKDKARMGEALREIDQWNFERIIVSHGEIVTSGGKEIFRRGFSKYLRA